MPRRLAFAFLVSLPLAAAVVPGHRLPPGAEHPVREREVHIERYRAALRFDMEKEEVAGTATITFTPLRAGLTALSLDAADLEVSKVTGDGGKPLPFALKERKLTVELGAPGEPGRARTVAVSYRVRPRTGLYFFPKSAAREAEAWNYGEGGLHFGWLPIYNDTNDKFAVEVEVTVEKPYVVVSNGVLAATRENADGTRTFRWAEERPIPNYLIALDVGDFRPVKLATARVGKGVPLTVWTPPGTEEAARRTFEATPRMVEFFSKRLGVPFPWVKYDQVVLREFAIGAMETATATGFAGTVLRRGDDPPDDAPELVPYPAWTAEDTISHELAHHWFGDLVTCRSLGSIWLNESFASFCHTLWTGESKGEDDLGYQRWRYRDRYLAFVHETGTVRPMEFPRWDAPEEMYEQDLTYLKGALVLHQLRHVVGDADFFRTLAAYLKEHADGNVDAADLLAAFGSACGRNLKPYFDDWITGGGGHPVFEVETRFSPERKEIDLTVRQLQADLPFENDFALPVDVAILTSSGTKTHRVEVAGWETHVALPSAEKPLAVVFDAGGWTVSEVRYRRPVDEVLEQLSRGGLSDRLAAARQLGEDFPRLPESADALRALLLDPQVFWGLRQEAAADLGRCGTPEAVSGLAAATRDPDRRVRRAAAFALGKAGSAAGVEALRRLVAEDEAEDVVALAEAALGALHAPGARELLVKQLDRDSKANEWIRLGALTGLAALGDPGLAPTFASYTDSGFDQRLRLAALAGWLGAAPEDPKLAETLRKLTSDRNRAVRQEAVKTLASLHRAADVPLLRELSRHPDPNLAQAAREGAEEIGKFAKTP